MQKPHKPAETRKKKISPMTAAAAALLAVAVLSILFKSQVRDMFTLTGLESLYTQAERYPAAVYFPDIGNAGCALVHTDGGDVLIDCGREKAQSDIRTTLENLGVEKIDLCVLTHPDSDHIGNFARVIGEYGTDRFVTCEYCETCDTPLYTELKTTVDNIEYAHAGDVLDAAGVRFEVLSPAGIYKSANDNSVVLRMTFGDFRVLFAGDITNKVEKDILARGEDISADVLYVAHHGSGGSTSEEFLRAVSPKYAVISCEENNYLPSGETIRRLMDCGCEIYRTDVSGMVAVYSDGEGKIDVRIEDPNE